MGTFDFRIYRKETKLIVEPLKKCGGVGMKKFVYIVAVIFTLLLLGFKGCFSFRMGNESPLGGELTQPIKVVSGKVIYEPEIIASNRFNTQGSPVENAEVWILELPDVPHVRTNQSGIYTFFDVPFQKITIVASINQGEKILKMKGDLTSPESREFVKINDIKLAEANFKSIGILKDSKGDFLPPGTKLYLWGELFFVGPNGRFVTPMLPANFPVEKVYIEARNSFPAQWFDCSFISDVLPAETEYTVYSDTETSFPRLEVIFTSGLKDKNRVDPGARVGIKAKATDFSGVTVGLTYDWSTTNGKIESALTNIDNIIWIAPNDIGVATITVTASDSKGKSTRVNLPIMIGIQVPPTELDEIPPQILEVYPASGSQQIPLDSDVTVTFNEKINEFSAKNGIQVVAQKEVVGAVFLQTDRKTLKFFPNQYFSPETLYTVHLRSDITDLSGNKLGTVPTWSFKTEKSQIIPSNEPPKPVLKLLSERFTSLVPIEIEVVFDQQIKAFNESNLNITNGNVLEIQNVSLNRRWIVKISPTSNGDVKVFIPGETVTGINNIGNLESNLIICNFDNQKPNAEIILNANSPTNLKSIEGKILFSEIVNGFTLDDILLSNSVITYFNEVVPGKEWDILVEPLTDGQFTLKVLANTVSDRAGNSNLESNLIDYLFTSVGPTITISDPIPAIASIGPVIFEVEYTNAKEITLKADDISLIKTGIVDAAITVSGSNNKRNIVLDSIMGDGSIQVSLISNTARDGLGNPAASIRSNKAVAIDNSAPSPSGNGLITISNLTSTSLQLNWEAAIDNYSTAQNLEYRVFQSQTGNIETPISIETTAVPISNWERNLTYFQVNDLQKDTQYYFNLLVKDEVGIVASYKMIAVLTPKENDVISPTVGNLGALNATNITTSGVTVNWAKATDNLSSLGNLQYLVYYSTSNNIDTVANAEANGTAFGSYSNDISLKAITGLIANTTYYFNVVVRDEAGNKSAYTSIVQATLSSSDVIAPTVGDAGTLIATNITTSGATISWTKAVDIVSSQANLQYLVYYSTSNNIDTVANAEANGTAFGSYSNDISLTAITGLIANTTYYFNVIVRDEAGNKSAYTSISQSTLTSSDVVTPTAGNSGALTASNITTSGVTINWTKATDNVSSQANLQYLVYYSTSNNIDTVANAEANGTAFGSYSNDISLTAITGLIANTTYYFNVIVRDEAGNKSAYTSISQSTLTSSDVVTPTAGNSGALTASNITTSGVTINWTKATDNVSSQANLQYLVYYSTSNNIDTAANAEANGTAFGSYSNDISLKAITGLIANTTYYFNVIVRDEAGNKSAYTSISLATLTSSDVVTPTAGNSGALTASNITTSGVTINWTKATDNVSSQANLKYLVYYSTSNNIATVANAEANGTAFGAYTSDISLKNITGLIANTTYYFNVIVRDEAGNKSAYTSISQSTLTSSDVVAPTAGNSGALTASNITTSGVTINWAKATDNVSSQANLQYLVYYSTSNNIATVANAEANGTAFGAYTNDISLKAITGLSAATTYYFNVIVKDEAGNKTAYTGTSQATLAAADVTAPVAGAGGALSASGVTSSGVTINWTKATDNVSSQADLQYLVYYSTSNNIATVANAEANGTAFGAYTNDISLKAITGLSAATTYYFNVIVKDEAGNKTAYTSTSQATLAVADVTAPVVGAGGALSASGVTSSGVTINWTKATDNVSSQANLQYLVYYSTSNNIATVANAEANGTAFGAYTNDISLKAITGLSAATTYYFNVIVKDEAGNKTAYTSTSQATLAVADVTAPVVGAGGALSASGVTSSGVTINWTKATDNVSSQANLQYLVYYSTSNNIATVANAEANGTAFGAYTNDISLKAITGLSAATTYYFNVIVKDEAGNKTAYTSTSQATLAVADVTAPVVGAGGALSASGVTSSGVIINWTKATDNVSSQANLQYLVYYSTSNNIATVANAEANGIAFGAYTNDISSQKLLPVYQLLLLIISMSL